ncbi:hypothetical protein CCP3SC1_520016 [Gammaproteobacteria bacterium]
MAGLRIVGIESPLAGHAGVATALCEYDADTLVAYHRDHRDYPGRAQIEAYLERHKHCSARELDLTVPCWDEEPRQLLQNLLTNLRRDDEHNPRLVQRASRERYASEAAHIHHAGLLRHLAAHRALLELREEMRDLSTRMYRLLRRAFLGGVSDLDIAVAILQTWVSGDFLP